GRRAPGGRGNERRSRGRMIQRKPRPGARSPGRGRHGLVARALRRCLQGTRASPFAGSRLQRALPTTHALHGLWPAGDEGSTAATRKLTFAFDGWPPSLNVTLVHEMGCEIVAGLAGSVACCTTNPCLATPLAHFATTSPSPLPGLTARLPGAARAPSKVRLTTSRLNAFTLSAEPPQNTVTVLV